MINIALWNASGLENLGDRLIDFVSKRELGMRLPGTAFQSFSPWQTSSSLPLVQIDRHGGWACEGQFDGIVIGGGALLIGPPFIHPSLQTCYLGPYPERFRDACPVVWNATCCDGQYVATLSPHWRDYVRSATQRLAYRSTRNSYTKSMLEDCGSESPIAVVPDPVTLIVPPTSQARRQSQRRRIGIAGGPSRHSSALLSILASVETAVDPLDETCIRPDAKLFIDAKDETDQRECLFAECMALAKSAMRVSDELEIYPFGLTYGDLGAARSLAASLEARLVNLPSMQWLEIMKWIKSLDCLVSTRLHGCILAAAVGTPVAAIDPYFNQVSGTSKLKEYMASMSLLASYIPLEDFLADPVCLTGVVDAAICGVDLQISKHQEAWIAASNHFDVLAGLIGKPASVCGGRRYGALA